MRRVAFTILFILGLLNAASLSSLHVDQPQSHAVQCEPHLARSDCHADFPHEHEATHAGEESLFEYIFEVSREATSIGLAFVLAPSVFLAYLHLEPVSVFSAPVFFAALPPTPALATHQAKSRAPPFCSPA